MSDIGFFSSEQITISIFVNLVAVRIQVAMIVLYFCQSLHCHFNYKMDLFSFSSRLCAACQAPSQDILDCWYIIHVTFLDIKDLISTYRISANTHPWESWCVEDSPSAVFIKSGREQFPEDLLIRSIEYIQISFRWSPENCNIQHQNRWLTTIQLKLTDIT